MSVTLVFHSFTSIANVQLYRALKFKRIGTISFISNIVNTSLSFLLAIKGFGLYAMISYVTFGPILTTALLYTTSVKLPKILINRGYVRGIFSFGGWLTLSVICKGDIVLCHFPVIPFSIEKTLSWQLISLKQVQCLTML